MRILFECFSKCDTNGDGASPTRTFLMRAVFEPDHDKRICSAGHLDVSIRGALGPYALKLGKVYAVTFVEVG